MRPMRGLALVGVVALSGCSTGGMTVPSFHQAVKDCAKHEAQQMKHLAPRYRLTRHQFAKDVETCANIKTAGDPP